MFKKKNGFTLIELLVVIFIIMILASTIIVSLNTARQRSRDARRISDLTMVASALQLYYADNHDYPANGTTSNCSMNISRCWFVNMINGLKNNAPSYISSCPVDPSSAEFVAGSDPCNFAAATAANSNTQNYRYSTFGVGIYAIAVKVELAANANRSNGVDYIITNGLPGE